MSKKKLPIWSRKLLKYTAYEPWPTDIELDSMVQRARYILRAEWPELKRIFRKKVWRFFRYGWRRIIFTLILLSSIIAAIYLFLLKPLDEKIVYLQPKIEYVNGLVHNDTVLTIPPERSILNKENLDYFACEFDIKYWYYVRQQIIIETGLKSESCIKGHNLFGMKRPYSRETTATGEYLGHASYDHWVYSLLDYKLWQDHVMRRIPINSNESYYNWLVRVKYAEAGDYINALKTVRWSE